MEKYKSKHTGAEIDAGIDNANAAFEGLAGKLDANKLPEAVNAALAQAKASGEFDGKDGKDGTNGTNGKDGTNGIDGEDGKDGFSPTVTTNKSGKVTTITITDKNGTKTATINDGIDGKDGTNGSNGTDGKDGTNGKDGVDGVSPTVSVSKSGKVTTVTITDKNGTKTATISDGADGTNGVDGKDGVSATHSWNGTTLTVTSASGTSSANLKGDKGEDGTSVGIREIQESELAGDFSTILFTDGNNLNIRNGKDGTNGTDGQDGTSIYYVDQKFATNPDGYSEIPDPSGMTFKIGDLFIDSSYRLYRCFGSSQTLDCIGTIMGATGNAGVGIKSVTQTTTSSADGGSNVITVTKTDNTTSTFTVKNGSQGSKGDTGENGFSILRVTTALSSYTTVVGGFTPKYRIALSTVLSESGASEVRIGDTILRNYYTYLVGYVDDSYVYVGAYASIRGTAGTSVTITDITESTADGGDNVVTFSDNKTLTVKNGSQGSKGDKGDPYTLTSSDKTSIANTVKSSLPTLTLVGTDADGVAHTWTIYGS